jgi:anti-anti-sigma regulatory factor
VEITRKELAPGVVVLELRGPLQMGVECKRLELAVDDLLSEKKTRVVLDLSNVSKVDSGGVGKIVNCLSRLRVAGGRLRYDWRRPEDDAGRPPYEDLSDSGRGGAELCRAISAGRELGRRLSSRKRR